ncbi:hypothetical protein GPOL_c12670 [Gordonia polyisoprenivorans VH2]|uniref:Uncharacterized protein n=1 Tax=Gordonia polyisoprenivorans (strain DSM 44266 / VH2) TaxID=1112204 RepID=H6N3G3_GORPV|nr:hypothetical protein GPOL_c12670 [Gordonia polyisoprenivorans VH2]
MLLPYQHSPGEITVSTRPRTVQIDAAAAAASSWLGKRLNPAKLSVENTCPDGVGKWVEYENAHVYWSPSTGAHAILGFPRKNGHG